MDEIAAKCGFVSRSFFSTTFSRECGMPPAKYRASMRRD
jgi:transcriptional regulator GlxA family with amidase domain